MEDKLHTYRQPLVTATGIILGFILSYAATFVKIDSGLNDVIASVVAVCMLFGIICLIVVLGRILKMNYPKAKAEEYYQSTLTIFLFGVSISFIGVMIDFLASFISE